jgi:hypothetical protein
LTPEWQGDVVVAMLKNGQPAKPNLMDRIGRWMSTVRDIDGLWVGAFTNRDEAALQRVEEALQLMEQRSPLHYSRVVRNLDRIWINTLPDARAQYSCRLNTCELDERLVMQEETTPELIASAIVHETTHARLERWGVTYDEAKRHRIEAICLRRELNFVSELTGSEVMQEELRRSLDYYSNNSEFFLDRNMQQRFDDGSLQTLRHLGVPNWLVALLSKLVNLRRRLKSWRASPATQSDLVIPGRE